MKNIKLKHWKTALVLLTLMVITVGCERGFSDDIELSTFPTNGEIYTDAPVGLTDQFFISFDPVTGANTEAFDTDDNEAYEGTSSIRIDVPSPNDPNGSYVGGIFRDRGEGRDLTGYDALTFWVKGSTTATIATFGFGLDFEGGEYATILENIELSTNWKKIIIPIPDPSKLVQQKGMFTFSAGTQSTNGVGFTFWMDEIRFENLGTLGQPRPAILGGQDQTAQAPIDTSVPLVSLTQTFNLPTGQDVTVSARPAYFNFETSNPFVAQVDEQGVVSVVGPGVINPETGLLENTALITATLGGNEAAGSLTVQSLDIEVISIFSDVFANVAVDNYNGFYAEFQTTLGGAVEENGNNVITYTDLNFVAIEFYGRDGSDVQPIDATETTHLHVDVRVNEGIDPGDFVNFRLFNNFTIQGSESVGDYQIAGSELTANEWVEFDIPLSSFAGLGGTDALGALFTVTDGTIANLSLDNIYFYSEN